MANEKLPVANVRIADRLSHFAAAAVSESHPGRQEEPQRRRNVHSPVHLPPVRKGAQCASSSIGRCGCDAWARALLRAGMGYTAFGDAQWRDARSLSAGSFRASDSVPSSMSSRGG